MKSQNKMKMKLTHETVPDLEKTYGIDAEDEIIKILGNEISSHFVINEETLKKSGWVEWDNPYNKKKTWAIHPTVHGIFSTLPGYLFEYDLETNTFKYNGGEFSNITKEGFTGNIVDLNTLVNMLK